jgi:hypothetical protein
MFVRTKRVKQGDRVYEYLVLVESVRIRGKPRQRVVANLGRADRLDPARIDEMVKALSPYTQSTLVLEPHDPDETQGYADGRVLGPLPVLERLWQDLGIGPLLERQNPTAMPLEAAAFAMVAARFIKPLSKRATFRNFLSSVYWPRGEGLSLHHLYRALDLLTEVKEPLEAALWARTRTLFSPPLDLVLMDTTNTYVQGVTRGRLAQFGHSKDKRFDRRLISVGVLVTRDGVPIGHEVFPGNTHDAKAFREMLQTLKRRVDLGRVILCADRGMVTEEILTALRESGVEYVVGARLTLKAEAALSYRGARWEEVPDLAPLRIKACTVGGETYVVCHNPEEEVHDRKRRQEIVARLKEALEKNPSGSSLLRNSLFRPYVEVVGKAVRLSEEAIARQARLDGKYILRANTQLESSEIARVYRQLWRVERAFREVKGPFQLRPLRHFVDRRIRGHVMVCFMAYALEMAIRQGMAKVKAEGGEAGVAQEADYHQVMEDLSRLTVATLVSGGRRYVVRSPLRGRAYEAFAAAGMRPPPRVLEAPPNDPLGKGEGQGT